MASTTKQFTVTCSEDYREIIMAEFAAIGFDSFQETAAGFIGHSESDIDSSSVNSIINRYTETAAATVEMDEIQQVNWNKKWEESYEPTIIASKIHVRASFHDPKPELPIEIVIDPKMSFGTGHHETTSLMMELQLEINHHDAKILDAGCGTGILTILAGKLGAGNLTAFDNDEWVKDNIQENFKNNHTISDVLIGTINSLELSGDYDIILANINKNILLHDIPYYAQNLNHSGNLLLSGFYEEDLDDIINQCSKSGLKFNKSIQRNRWTAAHFTK